MSCAVVLVSIFFALLLTSYTSLADDLNNYDDGYWMSDLHCRTGQHQSPVNITKNAVLSNNNVTVYFQSYHKLVSAVITTQHGIMLKVNESDGVSLKIGNRTEYNLHSLHFHVTCTEHRFEGKSYITELHLVHYIRNSEGYERARQAISQGLSVVGVLFEESESENEAINVLIDMLKTNSTQRGLDKKTLQYRDLLPESAKHIYQYSGSLTTTPCYETVLWNVISQTNYISLRQMRELQRLQPYMPSCRKPQPLHDRKFYQLPIWVSGGASVPYFQSFYFIIFYFLGYVFIRCIKLIP